MTENNHQKLKTCLVCYGLYPESMIHLYEKPVRDYQPKTVIDRCKECRWAKDAVMEAWAKRWGLE